MKRLFLLFILNLILFSNANSSDERDWRCEVSSSSNSKCFRSFDGHEENEFLGASTEQVYIGEISNSLPNGKGEMIFKHTKINDKYERSVEIGFLQKNAKGYFKTDPKNPHLKPKPKADEDSGSNEKLASFNCNFAKPSFNF